MRSTPKASPTMISDRSASQSLNDSSGSFFFPTASLAMSAARSGGDVRCAQRRRQLLPQRLHARTADQRDGEALVIPPFWEQLMLGSVRERQVPEVVAQRGHSQR